MTGNERGDTEESRRSRGDGGAPRSGAPTRTVRRWLFRALAVAASLLLTFAVFELLVRAFDIGPSFHVVFRESIRPSDNPVLEYELQPLARDGRSRISSTGLRDRESPLAKPPDVFRIAAIGDSVTYGSGGPGRTSWVERLEELLDDRATADAPRFEVLNLGVPGYNISQIVERLRVLGLAHEPDLIIYGYVLNDPQSYSLESEALKELRGGTGGARGFFGSHTVRWLIHSRLFLLARSFFTPSVSESPRLRIPPDPAAMAFRGNRIADYLRSLHYQGASRDRFLRVMDDLARAAGDAGVPVLFTVFFDEGAGAYPAEDVHAFVADEARRRGFVVTDLLEPLAAARERLGRAIHLDFLHPNVAGNQAVARALFVALCEGGLLPTTAFDCPGGLKAPLRRAGNHPEASRAPPRRPVASPAPRGAAPGDSARFNWRTRAKAPGRDLDIGLLALRVIMAALALLLIASGLWSRGSGRSGLWSWWRHAAFGILAVAAFSVNYNFFLASRPHGFHRGDVYHYYLNSKYFPELGYFRLYECSIAVMEGDPDAEFARDLRSNRMTRVDSWTRPGPRCDGAFSAERWGDFASDVRWFKQKLGTEIWRDMLRDHGYNPSPVWTLTGRPLSSLFPAEDASIRFLARIDRWLLLVSFAAVAWAFGFEAMCIAVVAFGTIPWGRYSWMGDCFLRYAWFAPSMIGIFLLMKEKFLGAGVLMSWSALLRLFPVLFIVGYVIKRLRLLWRTKLLDRGFRRFAIGAFASGLVLLAATTVVSGRGFDTWGEFAAKIERHSQITNWMTIGLRPLLSQSSEKPEMVWVNGVRQVEQAQQQVKDKAFASRRIYYWAAVLVFLLIFWRALGKATDWEAAALGFSLILVFLQPAAYYLSFVVAVALLATRRPRIGIALMATTICWDLAAIYHYDRNIEYTLASAVALALSFYVLLEMQVPAREPRAAREAAG